MINSKLLQLFKSLSPPEVRELESFLQSPFHNTNSLLLRLYKILRRQAPHFKESRLRKEEVADQLFAKEEKDKVRKLQYAMSAFVKLIEHYLVEKELQKKKEEEQFLLLTAYKRRGLDKFFFKKTIEFERSLEKSAYRDIEYFFQKYRLNNAILTHPTTEKVSKEVAGFRATFDALDNFYLGSKFLQAMVAHDREQTFEQSYDFFFKKELLTFSKQKGKEDIPLFKIYKLMIKGAVEKMVDQRIQIYFELKTEVLNNLSLFREPYREDLVICVLNFATRLQRQGIKDFEREVFEFYRLLLEDYYASREDLLQSSVYINAVILACELNEQEWANRFITEGAQQLDAEERPSMEALSKAYLACSQKSYSEALVHLRDIVYPNAYYNYLAKFLSVRCFFESEEDELLYTFLKTFENFTRRHTQLVENRKLPILHFIKFTRKLYANKYQKKYSQDQLIAQLEETPAISWSSWLRRKIMEQ